MTGPLIQEGGVLFEDGRIADVGPASILRSRHQNAIVADAGDAIILPGLINAHTHLELSLLTPGEPTKNFVEWLISLMSKANPAEAGAGMLAGIEQCLRFGITAVGDITSQPAMTRPLLARSPLRGVSYGEVRAMAQRRAMLQPRLAAAVQPTESSRITSGISPHAPYSIESTGYEACLMSAREHCLPLATHLAETRDEAEFLGDHSGAFRRLWDLLDAWDENVPTSSGGPILFAKYIGLLDYPSLLAHVNYCSDAELELLTASQASVVYCPRTHAFFGHQPHRWRDMLARGINVAVGTDSCASSLDLNLVDDLRLLHRLTPEIDVLELWKLATVNAARAIGGLPAAR